MRPPPRILATQRMPPTTKTSDPETSEQPAGYVGPMPADPAPTPDPTAAATEAMPPALGVMAAGDRCANCGSPMAHDQRYCLECGERRGQARFTVPADATVTTTTTVRGATGFQRFSSGTTLIAGIATLLLAMGVGVLIGRSGNSSPASNSKVQVLSVGTSGASAATTGGASTGSTHSPSSSAKSGSKSSHHTAAHSSSTGGVKTVKSKAPPTVTIGAKGKGAGYQGGHFTGNFFGGGG
jgi:hypothetical protein